MHYIYYTIIYIHNSIELKTNIIEGDNITLNYSKNPLEYYTRTIIIKKAYRIMSREVEEKV